MALRVRPLPHAQHPRSSAGPSRRRGPPTTSRAPPCRACHTQACALTATGLTNAPNQDVGGNGGNGGKRGGGMGGHSTRDVGCGALWRDGVGGNGAKNGRRTGRNTRFPQPYSFVNIGSATLPLTAPGVSAYRAAVVHEGDVHLVVLVHLHADAHGQGLRTGMSHEHAPTPNPPSLRLRRGAKAIRCLPTRRYLERARQCDSAQLSTQSKSTAA